ncbi:MAG: GH3 auxin-responsive promoter family protein, partial [Verrucomicrobiota bacterium]
VRGEQRILTSEPVTRLIPTSGSTRARKLIPFTASLQREFNAAIAPWISDLYLRQSSVALGPAYWSITPALQTQSPEVSAVPIGFDDDTGYLGGARKRFVDSVMAVPSELRLIKDLEIFRYVTLLCLLRQRDLRLISVWHPSFLSLLLDALPQFWEDLLNDIKLGQCKHSTALPKEVLNALNLCPLSPRAKELQTADPRKPPTFWPRLKVISCWGDGSAEFATIHLKKLFPNTILQSKGLLATEAFVTIPFAGAKPVAVCSHFFEFIDDASAIRLVHELIEGETYEVVVTTASGLWRYRLGDCVQVTGFVGQTPSLRFLGRSGNVSDLFGEKLSETFVAKAIQETFASLNTTPRFVLLAPDEDAAGCRYTLYVEGATPGNLVESFDRALRHNPHYAYCRDLGQLLPVRVFTIAERGYEIFLNRLATQGAHLGDIKPAVLSRMSGWSNFFPKKCVENMRGKWDNKHDFNFTLDALKPIEIRPNHDS